MESESDQHDDYDDNELDPRIQIELEKLNTATDDINKLEIELDESNTTFRMLLNESTRRLQALSRRLGSCIERARPYWEALEVARDARVKCQRAAVAFQRASEIHAAAKETVALAEQRFMSQSDWQFDSAWQEMLNHATTKVTEAEIQKAASGREHRQVAALFTNAEQHLQALEERHRRNIIKSRPYFEEKQLCQEQLSTQKQRVEDLQRQVSKVKKEYAESLKTLEAISEEIHHQREMRKGPREPGVGAEKCSLSPVESVKHAMPLDPDRLSFPDLDAELDRCDMYSLGSVSVATTTASECDDLEHMTDVPDERDMMELRLRVTNLNERPIEGCSNDSWQEMGETVDKLNHLSLIRECEHKMNSPNKTNNKPIVTYNYNTQDTDLQSTN